MINLPLEQASQYLPVCRTISHILKSFPHLYQRLKAVSMQDNYWQGTPPGERKDVKNYIWLVLKILKRHVFFQLFDQFNSHCV